MAGTRALKAVRQSRNRGEEDPTTSPKRQLQTVEKFIAARGYSDAGLAQDLDKSAYKLPPLARPELGDWLTFKADQFDLIVWSSLDRAVRRMADMSDLARWAKEHGKTLVFCSGPGGSALTLDMSNDNPMSQLIAQVLSFAAEMEAYNDRERALSSREYLRTVGRYGGGWVAFGYEPVPNPDGNGLILAPGKYAPVVRRMAVDILDGQGPSYVARWLNDERVPTSKDAERVRVGKEPQGVKWSHWSVQQILRSRQICGVTEYKGEVVRDETTGLPVMFGEPIIEPDQWERVQDALDGKSRPRKIQRVDSPWLTGVLHCTDCGRPVYSNRSTVKGKTYSYLRCAGVRTGECDSRNMRLADAENAVGEWIAANLDGRWHMELNVIKGRSHAGEIAVAREAITEVGGKLVLAEAMGEECDTERAQLASLKTRLSNLLSMRDEPDRMEWVRTGLTVPQHWAQLDSRGKHALLVSRGVKLHARQDVKGLALDVEPGSLGGSDPGDVSKWVEHVMTTPDEVLAEHAAEQAERLGLKLS